MIGLRLEGRSEADNHTNIKEKQGCSLKSKKYCFATGGPMRGGQPHAKTNDKETRLNKMLYFDTFSILVFASFYFSYTHAFLPHPYNS